MELSDSDVPEIISHFYHKFDYVSTSEDEKVTLVAHCKKCNKSLFRRQSVTSNLLSHVKVTTFFVNLFNPFATRPSTALYRHKT